MGAQTRFQDLATWGGLVWRARGSQHIGLRGSGGVAPRGSRAEGVMRGDVPEAESFLNTFIRMRGRKLRI